MKAKNSGTSESSCCAMKAGNREGAHIDPVCGMRVEGGEGSLSITLDGVAYYFCSRHCRDTFQPRKDATEKRSATDCNRAVFYGALATVGLLMVFLGVVYLSAGGWQGLFYQVSRLWYWALILAGGFGFQLGLFLHIRYTLRRRMKGATAEVAVSGAISTGSMLACCSHGLVNLLPVLGISAAATFLARYQLTFLLLGVFSNLIGVTIMLGIAKKHGILFRGSLFELLSKLNLKVVRVVLIVIGSLALIFSALRA